MAARPTYTTQPTQHQHYVVCTLLLGDWAYRVRIMLGAGPNGWLMCVLLQRLQAVLRASLEQPCNVLCPAAGNVAGICRRGKPEGQRHDAPATAPVVQVLRGAVLLRTWVASRCAVTRVQLSAVLDGDEPPARVRASARAPELYVWKYAHARGDRGAGLARSAAARAPTSDEGGGAPTHER